jgi:uncharacterized protein (DUF58 family)
MMVRVLQEERNLTVFFLFDVSDSMLFSSHDKLKCEYAAELIATLGFSMHEVGDSVGLAMFSDKIVKVVPPGIGRNQFYKIVKSLSDPSLYGGKFDLEYALRYVLNIGFLQKDSIIFIVSDFIGMKSGWEYALKLAGLKYDLSAIILRDPIDMRLPQIGGEISLADPYGGKQMLVNPLDAREKYESESKGQIAKIKAELNKTRSSLLVLETDKPFTNEIFKFFRMRQKWKS